MNLLAHFYLSYPDEALTAGNFLGDFIKGRQYQQFQPAISRGILLHREIDSFTDQHRLHRRSKRRLHSRYGHYAGVAVDMFYDHLLASAWNQYADLPLKDFSTHIYQILEKHQAYFPENARYVLRYMRQHDWLYSYREIKGIGKALEGISRRTAYRSYLEQSVVDLQENFLFFEEDFASFFPELILHIRNHLSFLT
ncbi:MAG: ACP phosphodiesterase [Cyclobacteriaceae bacterium]